MPIKLFTLLALLVVGFVALSPKVVLASTTNGTISGYAWSAQIGWINFGTTGGNSHITDSAVTGYAWNENFGWINLNPTNSGVANDNNGNLSGRAWSQGTGWINFSGVTVSSSGAFSGTATGDNSVNINFSCTKCNVTTDWRPASSRTTSTSSSGGTVYGSPAVLLSLSINNGSPYANNQTVQLYLAGGADSDKMAISNSSDFSNAIKEDYKKSKIWVLTALDGPKKVFAKFYSKYGAELQTVSSAIVLDTTAPEIKITSIKDKYSQDEEIIIRGAAESNARIDLLTDSEYGSIRADENGQWILNLGKLNLGSHHLDFTAIDLAGNKSKAITAEFLVEKSGAPTPPPSFGELLKPLIPKFFQPSEKKPPQIAVTVPKITPLAFNGSFSYLATAPLSRFVLAPLPQEIKLLAQKFPQLEKTFKEVGVTRFSEIEKLKKANLKLPSLTEAVIPPPKFTAAKFSIPKGIPVAGLSEAARINIPSDIVFAKASNGLVDLNIALSITNKGAIEQKIKTIIDKYLQLVVRPDRPAKRVRGYIVFKSKQYYQSSFQVPLDKLAASLIFSNPNFTSAVEPNLSISVEGGYKNGPSIQVLPPEANSQKIDKRLVLTEFEYQNKGNGVYMAEVRAPAVDGEYEIITVIDYLDALIQAKEIKLITVVDPEGYVYEKDGNLETRIIGAIVSLYWLNPATKQYELWPAKDFQQENPQITDASGKYSFLVPEGFYYLKVEAPGYLNYDGKPFEVKDGSSIHTNIELKSRYWFIKNIDWKTVLLIIVILILAYNFYRDKMEYNMAKKIKE